MTNFVKKNDPKYIDLLDEDMPVSGQKFVCISFISPEKILKNKELYFFNEFLKQYDLNKSLEKFNQFLNFISYKYKINFENITKDLQEFINEEKDNLHNLSLYDEYKTFLDNKEEKLEEQFNNDNNFQTSVRGIKIRGSYPSQEEAELHCKMLREIDQNHDVFVGPVGTWMPWDPEAYKTGKTEYIEEELNQLMSEKIKNEKEAKLQFEKRLRESKKQAIEDNIEKAKNSGNLLTQTINNEGDLISMNNISTVEKNLLSKDGEITNQDIKKELFEGENIIIDNNNDKGLSQLSKINEAPSNDGKIG